MASKAALQCIIHKGETLQVSKQVLTKYNCHLKVKNLRMPMMQAMEHQAGIETAKAAIMATNTKVNIKVSTKAASMATNTVTSTKVNTKAMNSMGTDKLMLMAIFMVDLSQTKSAADKAMKFHAATLTAFIANMSLAITTLTVVLANLTLARKNAGAMCLSTMTSAA